MKVLYNGEEVGTAKVYIGIKGDTDLNGKVEATDMFYNMYYQARLGAGIKEGVTLLEIVRLVTEKTVDMLMGSMKSEITPELLQQSCAKIRDRGRF